jgi:hypothetical protein
MFNLLNCSIESMVNDLKNFNPEEMTFFKLIQRIERLRFDESRPDFFMSHFHQCESKQDRVKLYESLSEKYKIPVGILGRYLRIQGICQRVEPPLNLVSFQDVKNWAINKQTDFRTYYEYSNSFLGYFSSLYTCLLVKRYIQSTPEFLKKAIKSMNIIIGKWKISEPMSICIFQNMDMENMDPYFLSFRVSCDSTNLYVQTSVLEIEFEDLTLQYIFPWSPLFYKSSFHQYIRTQEEIDEFFVPLDVLHDESLTRFVPLLEDNILTTWGVKNNSISFHDSITGTHFAADFMNSYVYCFDLNLQTPQPPKYPHFTRENMIELINCVSEKHMGHILSRFFDLTTTLIPSKSTVVSFLPGPGDFFLTVFVSILYKLGARYHTCHAVFFTNNQDDLKKIIEENWCTTKKWINEHVFHDFLVKTRMSSHETIVPILPIGRLYCHDPHTPQVIKNGRWKLAGCSCVSCERVHSSPFVF